jgi:hypothetical protein
LAKEGGPLITQMKADYTDEEKEKGEGKLPFFISYQSYQFLISVISGSLITVEDEI